MNKSFNRIWGSKFSVTLLTCWAAISTTQGADLLENVTSKARPATAETRGVETTDSKELRPTETIAPGVILIQHNEDSHRPKKDGAFKKFIGKLNNRTSDTSGNQGNGNRSGERSLAPPPIDFNVPSTPKNGQQTQKQKQVPTFPAGLERTISSPPTSQWRAEEVTPVFPVPKRSTADPQQVTASPVHQRRTTDGFESPFKDKETTGDDERLLDLDSLIEEIAPTRKVSKEISIDRPTPDTETPAKVVEKEKERQDAEASVGGPYTGFRLAVEDISEKESGRPEVLQSNASKAGTNTVDVLPDPVSEDYEQAVPLTQQPGQSSVPDLTSLPEEQKTSSLTTADSTDTGVPSLERIPLLEEGSLPKAQEGRNVGEWRTKDASIVPEIAVPQESESARIQVLDEQARREQQRYRIMARTSQSGLKGFCPVELRDRRELIDSLEEHKAKFGLRTYYFSTLAAKSSFESNPARYAPAAGGSDVVLLVNTGEDTEGSLDFSLWYRDRLYLFRSRETQAIFSQDPLRFADQY